MKIYDLASKNICILGFGREGQAMLEALDRHVPTCEVTIADKNDALEIKTNRHWKQLGTGWLDNLEKFDVIIKSPGIPLHSQLKIHNSKLTSATQIFFDTIAGSGATVIGVTGSKGKSTTASLIYAILKAGKYDAYLIGNIGKPAISYIDAAKDGTIFVFELSSYQLMDLAVSPHIAVLTSFFPEHLDYHGSLGAYQQAKENIVRFQSIDDFVIYNSSSADVISMAALSEGKKIAFSATQSPVTLADIRLRGTHNLGNIAAAFTVTSLLGIPKQTALQTIHTFDGLPHRLQSIGIFGGIEWVDDAISTTPQSAIAALEALGANVRTMILGGQDRGVDFTPLADALKKSMVRTVILFPGSGSRIRQAIETSGNAQIDMHEADTMYQAVHIAKDTTQAGNICLLSTASPSYGMFNNFEEKGDRFQSCVRELK